MQFRRIVAIRPAVLMAALLAWCAAPLWLACEGSVNKGDPTNPYGNKDGGSSASPKCPDGTDKDGDGYGAGCSAGADCDDGDPSTHAGATEVCDGVDNDCNGKVDDVVGNCASMGGVGGGPGGSSGGAANSPFPVDPAKDPNVIAANGVQQNPFGDLVLGSDQNTFRYIWIANTDDLKVGTISKVDSRALKEVARYFTITCKSLKDNGTACDDVHGKPLNPAAQNTPSRTAVDFNMDVWVANRCLYGGQPSATKIANDPADCIDRNKNGVIDTSADRDGDGKINVDCDGDGQPDSIATKCTGTLAGKAPEFLGYDDECVLFTSAYGDKDDIARSICLTTGKSIVGPSSAWVGTYWRPEKKHGNNLYYKLNGSTGQIEQTLTMPEGHHAYGCMADGHNLIWSTDIGYYDTDVAGNLTYFQTIPPYFVGKVLRGSDSGKPWLGRNGLYRQYGIAVDAAQDVWLGGINSEWVLRYQPDRTNFDTLGSGKWTRIDMPEGFSSRGIAPDSRGKIWVAIQQGYILRLEQTIAQGVHDMSSMVLNKDYWKVSGDQVIGSGVDFDGNIWAIGRDNDTASRLDVDAKGNVISPATGTTKNLKVGTHPYTYSDFTAYGLTHFVRPQGRWVYQYEPCKAGQKAIFKQVSWTASQPLGTSVTLRVRSADTLDAWGPWAGPWGVSPAVLDSKNPAPNPARYFQVEFTLATDNRVSTPTLANYGVQYNCVANPDSPP